MFTGLIIHHFQSFPHFPIIFPYFWRPKIPTYPHHFQTQTPKVAPSGGPQHPTPATLSPSVASPAPQSEDLAAPRRSRGGGSARLGPSSGPPCAGPQLPTTGGDLGGSLEKIMVILCGFVGSNDLKIRVVQQEKGDLREFH